MKTFKEFLKEKWHDTMPSPFKGRGHGHVEIYKNPSSSELRKIVHGSKHKSARGILHGDHAYVWDGDHALHHHIIQHLNLQRRDPNDSYQIKITKNHWGTDFYGGPDHGPGVSPLIKNHPWVKKRLAKHKIINDETDANTSS